jgi:hypothetical protein
MIFRLVEHIADQFKPSLQSDLERWLQYQNPKNGADLERLIKEYTYQNTGSWL